MLSMTNPPAEVSCTVRSRSGPRCPGRRCPDFAVSEGVAAAGVGSLLDLASPDPAERRPRRLPRRRRRLRIFAVGHPSDSSWRAQTLRAHSPVVSCGIGRAGQDSRTAQRARSHRVVTDYSFSRARGPPGCRAVGRCRGRVEQPCRRPARARRAVRRRRTRAVSGRRFGARRRAAATEHRPGLRHRRAPRAAAEVAAAVGRRAVGHRHRLRHHRRRRRAVSVWRSPRFGPTATTGCRATRRSASATRFDDDLVRRDFTVNAMAVRVTAAGAAEFVDPLNRLAALRAGVLDTPAPP